MKKVLLKDIADMAGVSQMTVSRVINAPDTVKKDTRERVEKIIQQMHYHPNSIAKALTTGKTQNIGLLVVHDSHNFPNEFMTSFLKGVYGVVQARGYNLMLLFDTHDGCNRILNENSLSAQRLDGLLILSIDSMVETVYPLSCKLQESGMAAVVVNQQVQDLNTSYVAADDFDGGFQAGAYLIGCGHRKIGVIVGSDQYATSWSRFRGFIHALEKHGMIFDPRAYAEGGYTKEGGYAAMKKMLENAPDMTAVFCASDLMALGAMKCCFDRHIDIPEKMSVIGYDDKEFASMLNPALTTVKKDRERMGRESAEILMDILSGREETVQRLIATEIVERESVRNI